LRPAKKILPIDAFKDFEDLPSIRRLQLTSSGLMTITLRQNEIAKPEGTLLPIEMQPFTRTGNVIE
jgi:hypothetical protein